jgi:hypothetical protein
MIPQEGFGRTSRRPWIPDQLPLLPHFHLGYYGPNPLARVYWPYPSAPLQFSAQTGGTSSECLTRPEQQSSAQTYSFCVAYRKLTPWTTPVLPRQLGSGTVAVDEAYTLYCIKLVMMIDSLDWMACGITCSEEGGAVLCGSSELKIAV